MKKIKLLFIITIIMSLIAGVTGCGNTIKKEETSKKNIVVTSFVAYDLCRAILKNTDKVTVIYLLKPGANLHSYEPTSSDLKTISNADLFIYNGTEPWIEKTLDSVNPKKEYSLLTTISLKEEKEVECAEEEAAEEEAAEEEEIEYDEHFWTSPSNIKSLLGYVTDEIIMLDETNKDSYLENSNNYGNEIDLLVKDINNALKDKVRNKLVFGDKMPMQYFLDDFGLTAAAAFMGCNTETEPGPSTITNLIEIVKKDKIPVVLYIEMGNEKVATIIASETGAETLQIQTLHNVSKEDFDNGETYITLMERNIDVLRKALY